MDKLVNSLTSCPRNSDWLVDKMKTRAQRFLALVASTLLAATSAWASPEFTLPSDQRPEDLPLDRLVDIVEDSNRADVALPAEWADQLVARFPEWITERYDEFSVNADLWRVEEFLDDLPADQAARILNNLTQHETSRVVHYGMLLELRLNPSYDALLALIDLGFDADQIVDDLGGRQLDAILRGSLVSDRPKTAVQLFRKFSCQRLLEAGITRKRVRNLEPANSPVRTALQERVDNIQCVYVSLDYDIAARNADLDEFLESLNDEGTGFTSSPRPVLPDDPNSDFRELPIRGGILIHDQCYENERLNEFGGMQSAVEEAIAKFASCQQDIREWQPGGAAQRLHIPEMMNILNGEIDVVPEYYPDADGNYKHINNACIDIDDFELYRKLDIKKTCVDKRAHKTGNFKVFCQTGQYGPALKESQGRGYDAELSKSPGMGTRHGMVFINWDSQMKSRNGSTKVYSGPLAAMRPNNINERSELISKLGHEFIHTLFSHDTHDSSYPLNDFATMCEASCFYDDWGKDRISDQEWLEADRACNSLEAPDFNRRATAQGIRRAL